MNVEMTDREKLDRINEVAGAIWNWMCDLSEPLVSLIPPIERIRELSESVPEGP